jgi:hypothetical protein
MAHKDPRQEVIAKLGRFLRPSTSKTQSSNTPLGLDNNRLGKETGEETGEGFCFLRERTIPGIPGRMMLAARNETRAPGQLLICYLEQNEQGEWRYSGGANTSLAGKSQLPCVYLGGGGWPDHFHVGGYVVTHGLDITHVRLLSVNGTVVEDDVIDGIVLFFSDQPVEIPLLAELYDRQGKLVADHNIFGSYSRLGRTS